ncbi:uncharacterized protein LOC123700416 [Colias croceus]|uniref:uncharacterized protein LOC123700416 n=1 Tax=Colias crocea TaxID=72248 RepID=UPI001E27FCE9|nr:uncharacterized protein LOC123700416 [Colias croceus]
MLNDSTSSNVNYLSFSSEDLGSEDSFHSTSSFTPLNNLLSNCFSNDSKIFNAVHINAQSVPAHFPDMLATFDSVNMHALLISESWFKPCLPSSCYSLPGYNLIRNDRIGKAGGGVAIYLRSHLTYKIISLSPQPPPSDAAEHLIIEVTLRHTKLLLGVFYSPSLSVNYFHSFESILDQLIPIYEHSLIMGDFNTCIVKNDSRAKTLKTIIESANLHLLPLNPTHTLPNCTPSLLDLIIVSSPNLVLQHGQYAANAFSHHDLIYISYNIRPPKHKPKISLRRNFAGVDVDRLCRDAQDIDWSIIYSQDNVDTMVELFSSLVTDLYDKHAPLRPVKLKHLPAPWLTDDLKSLLQQKSRAKTKLKLKCNDANREKYTKIRNRCNTCCRDAQRRHIHSSVENGDPAKVWKFLKTLGVGCKDPKADFKNFNIELLNQFFAGTPHFDNTTKVMTINTLSSIPTPNFPPFCLNQFTSSDVKKNIMSLSSNASGFRPGHGTTTALTKVTDDIRFGMDNKQLTLLTLLDFSNAFSSVDFDVLSTLAELPNAIQTMNNDLNSVVEWSNQFGLKVNPLKTQVIIVGSPSLIAKVDWVSLPAVHLCGTQLPYSKIVKDLGIYIDQTLSWDPQLKEFVRFNYGTLSPQMSEVLKI